MSGSAWGKCVGRNVLGLSCTRNGRYEFAGRFYCRTHLPVSPVIVADVDEDAVSLCKCGCEEPVNLLHSLFVTAAREGLTHQVIAARYGVSRSYVSRLIRKPPRFLPGHQAGVYWDSDAGRERQEAWVQRMSLSRQEAAARALDREQRRRDREAEVAANALVQAHRQANRAIMKKRKRQERWARVQRSAIWNAGSLDAPMLYGAPTHEFKAPDVTTEPLRVVELEEQRAQLLAIVGTLEPDDVLRIDSQTLSWIQEKLRSAGLVTHSIQRSERDRLRNPQAHSGVSVMKAGGHGGSKRSRAAQQQVTRDHHVRELPQAVKQADAQRRRYRKEHV